MNYEGVIAQITSWMGEQVAVSTSTAGRDGLPEYVADFAGRLVDAVRPIPDVDDPVVYFRWAESSAGLGIHADLFESAGWRTYSGEKTLHVCCGAVDLELSLVSSGSTTAH